MSFFAVFYRIPSVLSLHSLILSSAASYLMFKPSNASWISTVIFFQYWKFHLAHFCSCLVILKVFFHNYISILFLFTSFHCPSDLMSYLSCLLTSPQPSWPHFCAKHIPTSQLLPAIESFHLTPRNAHDLLPHLLQVFENVTSYIPLILTFCFIFLCNTFYFWRLHSWYI